MVRMFDPRIYRAGFLPALAALIVLLFSLQPAPKPIESPIAPEFNGRETARLARTLATLFPDRTPGSEGDGRLAERVKERFAAVPGGKVSTQEVESSWDGSDVALRNVLLTLPGELEEVVLVVAARDSPVGPGAASSAAATATLVSLADDLGGSRHEHTIVLASTSGLASGAKGVRELIDQLGPAGVESAVVISHPGVRDGEPPFVYAGIGAPDSVPPRLLATADAIASVEFEQQAATQSGWVDLVRLALPVGVGEAAALDDQGIDAVGLSGGGELPPAPDEDTIGSVSNAAIAATGGSALELTLALDGAPAGELDRDAPTSYLRVGDNLLPGWTLAALGLGLIVPAMLAAGDVFLRDRRRNPKAARRAIPWSLERMLLPLAALLVIYLLGVFGLLPSAEFPYDPARFPAGAEGTVAAIAVAVAVAVAALLVRPLRTPLDTEPQTLAAAAGLLLCVSAIGIWLLNPFLALLLAPLTHLWLLPARVQGPPSKLAVVITGLVLAAPAIAAILTFAGTLDLGLEAAWQLLLLIAGGQIGLLLSLLWCGLLGGLICCVAATGGGSELLPVREPERAAVRGPGGYAGPGSLGGTPSSGLGRS